jgi:ketosteroid isomerase-like protein
MTLEEAQALFAARAKAFARRDVAALVADFAEDGVLESQSLGVANGRAAVEKYYQQIFKSLPGLQVEIGTVFVSGDEVVASTTFSARDPEGRQFQVNAVLFVTFKDGRILRHRSIGNLDRLRLERVERDLKGAADVQHRLLPLGSYAGPGYEVAATSIACRAIGGDFFDYFELPNRGFGLALADVAGKGPPAALLSTALQGILSVHAETGDSPADVMTRVNLALLRRAVPARFATMVYAVLADTGVLHYCNAGHNPPLLIGRADARLETGGPALGILDGAVFHGDSVQLHPGDVVVVFSDGVTEALSVTGLEFGEDRLASVIRAERDQAPAALVHHILEAVKSFADGARQTDDVTVFVLKYVGQPSVSSRP